MCICDKNIFSSTGKVARSTVYANISKLTSCGNHFVINKAELNFVTGIIRTAFEVPDSKPNRKNECTDDSFSRSIEHFHINWGTYSRIGNSTRIVKRGYEDHTHWSKAHGPREAGTCEKRVHAHKTRMALPSGTAQWYFISSSRRPTTPR